MRTIIKNSEVENKVVHSTTDGDRPILAGNLQDGTTFRGALGSIVGDRLEIGGWLYREDAIANMTRINAH